MLLIPSERRVLRPALPIRCAAVIGVNQRLQLRADFFNFTNSRDFGIPNSIITSNNFLNQWGTDGGNRRIIVGLRYVF